MARDTAIKIREGEALTVAEKKAIQKDPEIRTLVKEELEGQGYEVHKIFAEALIESHEVGMGRRKDKTWRRDEDGEIIVEDVPIKEKDKIRARRHADNMVSKLEGLELKASERDRPPQEVHVHFHAAFDPKNKEYDTRTAEINVDTTPGTDSDNPSSTSQPLHNSDLRDKEWENVPGHGDHEVLGGKTR